MRKLGFIVVLAAGLSAPALAWIEANEAILGEYARPNGDAVQVFECEGRLCGRIVGGDRDGFEMLHGMDVTAENEWRGNRMKHPSMPGFMTFNGTVTVTGPDTLSVKGCAMGQSFCDAEVWRRR